jgi:transposase
MDKYVGLDVSMEETSVCILDGAGNIVFEGKTASQPDALATLLRSKARDAARIVFETGALASWLWHELKARNFPVICLDARHARAALSMRVNKTDRNDACGLAELARMGWYREANVKSMEGRYVHALLAARAKLVDLRRDIENQMRGLLKSLGLVPGKAGAKALLEKIVVVMREAPHLRVLFNPMMLTHSALVTQLLSYDSQIHKLAERDDTTRRLMTVPGVGPVTALAFRSTIDNPKRFNSSSDVGAYLGLTPRRYQSGELDRTGRISKRGDHLTRLYLFEAASVLLSVVKQWSVLKAWGVRLAKRIGIRKARTAVARKLAVILHRIWVDGTEFQWSKESIIS